MSYQDGQIIVRVALELGPFDEPGELDWTDLTDRVLAYRDERGRDDVLQPFGAGTAMVTLDNGDRMLDPSNPDGLLFDGVDPIGLPLCPVKITQWWDGAEYPKFTGVLGPEAWPGDTAPKGPNGETVLHVMDALGHSPGLPGDIWGILIASLRPDWWLRMDEQKFPILDDLSEIPNSIGAGVATISGTTGISRPFLPSNHAASYAGVNTPGLLLSGDHELRSPATSIMPDGDEDKFTTMLWWNSRDVVAAGDVAEVARMVNPATDVPRWRIYVDGDDGVAYVEAFDAAGSLVDSGSIAPFSISRWDSSANTSHLVIAVWDAADASFTVWFGGVSTALTIGSDLYESDLIIGPNPVDVLFDEISTWRRALVYETEIVPVLLGFGNGGVWSSDTWADRLGRWYQATGREADFDDVNEWHFPADGLKGLWGLLRPRRPSADDSSYLSITLPKNLAEAVQTTVDSGGGVRWATKENYLRARTIHALTDATYAAHYATPVLFTDEDATLGTDEYRHAGVETTGLRIDRVINTASVDYIYAAGVDDTTGPVITGSSPMTNRALDRDSRARYGVREHSLETAWSDWVLNQSLVELVVERYAQPRQEIERIHLDPLGDDSLAEWLITTCELELACDVTYTPAAGDPVTVEGLNIQHIAFDWTPERWTVDILAAAS